MIMQPANDFIGLIHDQVGVILEQGEVDIWLNRELPVADRLDVLHPVADNVLEGWQVVISK